MRKVFIAAILAMMFVGPGCMQRVVVNERVCAADGKNCYTWPVVRYFPRR